MAVDVYKSKKEKEDPLDKLVKLTSIGTSIAGLASKAGGKADGKATPVPDVEEEFTQPELGESAVSEKPSYGLGVTQDAGKDVFSRRMSKIKLGNFNY